MIVSGPLTMTRRKRVSPMICCPPATPPLMCTLVRELAKL